MRHEDELSFHESGADVPVWSILTFLLTLAFILGIVLFLILGGN